MRKFVMFILVISFVLSARIAFANSNDTGRFGVMLGGQGKMPRVVNILKDLGCNWTRINNNLDGNGVDIQPFLEAGFNVVITIGNRDPSNMDTTYGTLINAGYPFKSKEVYQDRIRKVLTPLLPYLKQGRQIWVQCENEVGDASTHPKARFWRGTMAQYSRQLDALYEAVKALDPSIPVVLSSFTSEQLRIVINPDDPRYTSTIKFFTGMLTKGRYDAVDLHFYGCVEDIPAKAQWVKAHMPAGKLWISTENGGPDSRCPHTPMSWEQNPEEYERIQAEQVSARLNACAENGASVSLWFSFFDMKDETDWGQHMGLIDPSKWEEYKKQFIKGAGKKQAAKALENLSEEEKAEKINPYLRKKPAYYAFKSFVAGH